MSFRAPILASQVPVEKRTHVQGKKDLKTASEVTNLSSSDGHPIVGAGARRGRVQEPVQKGQCGAPQESARVADAVRAQPLPGAR